MLRLGWSSHKWVVLFGICLIRKQLQVVINKALAQTFCIDIGSDWELQVVRKNRELRECIVGVVSNPPYHISNFLLPIPFVVTLRLVLILVIDVIFISHLTMGWLWLLLLVDTTRAESSPAPANVYSHRRRRSEVWITSLCYLRYLVLCFDGDDALRDAVKRKVLLARHHGHGAFTLFG